MNTLAYENTPAIEEVRANTAHMREAATTLTHTAALLQKAAGHLDAAEFIDHATGRPVRPEPELNGLLRRTGDMIQLAAAGCDRNATMAEAMLKIAGITPAPTRPPHQQRVIDELAEVEERRAALFEFIEGSDTCQNLDACERGRLIRQAAVMESYCSILTERVQHFAA